MIAAIKERASTHAGNPYLITIAVSLATFMEVLDTTITNVSLSHIAGELGASQDESTWVLTSYLVANAIVLPISGWLAGVIGRKRFFLMCIAGFTAASFACGAATSLPMLIIFRMIQGLAGGGLQPIQQAIVMDTFSPEKRGTAFALTGLTTILAPVLGPTLGGYITDSYSWRWVFYINIPFGLLAFSMVAALVHDPLHAMAKKVKKIDFIGLGLVALGIGALQIMLDKGQQEDWLGSGFIQIFALLAFGGLGAAIYWLLHQKDPIVDLHLFKIRSFAMACISMFSVGMALYSSSALLPMLTESQFGYNAFLAGMVLSPGAILLLFMMPLSGKLVSKLQPKYMMTFGFAVGAIGMWGTSHVTPQTDYNLFVLMRAMQVVALPFLFVPGSMMAFSEVPKELSSKASALFSLMRNIGGSIGIAAISSYVSHEQQVQQTQIVDHLQASAPATRELVSTYVTAARDAGYSVARSEHIADARIYNEIGHQASILAYNDAFIILAYGMMCLSVAMLVLMPKRKAVVKVDPSLAH